MVTLLALTRAQVERWRNGITLFEHTVAVTSDNYLGHYNLATYYEGAGNSAAAATSHYREAIRIRPNYSEAHNNLGALLLKSGGSALAIPHLSEAVRHDPDNAPAQFNLGLAYLNIRRPDSAIPHLASAAARTPGNPEILKMLEFARGWERRTVLSGR